jgi:hypothetical protein
LISIDKVRVILISIDILTISTAYKWNSPFKIGLYVSILPESGNIRHLTYGVIVNFLPRLLPFHRRPYPRRWRSQYRRRWLVKSLQ